MIESETDIEGNILAKKLIEKYSLSNKIETYEDYQSMISDLYKGKIGACFVSSNYAINLGGEEYEDTLSDGTKLPLSERAKVLYELSEKRKNEDVTTLNTNKSKKLTEPFTALIMGVDSTINGLTANQAFNGDTLIMVTFNPNTLTTTMFSIPRDMYVPIACNNNRYAKINSSAAYGSSCVINTVQQLTGIDIDYYVKINFTGVVDLVDVLGGVTVDVEEPDFRYNGGIDCGNNRICEQNSLRQFGKNMIYIDSGVQTLNGEQALAYARNRHQFTTSDIARNQHQQQIIEATALKLKELKTLKDFENVLNTISNNTETNMTPEQILSFYNVGKDMLLNT
ncbi:MAG: LCP family protein, partial [Bacilli bacterium]|nr:LCP family protein [Bacilli bacterium]